MKKYLAIAAFLVVASRVAVGDEPLHLRFQPAEKGYYAFDTGLLFGKVRVDGTYQGICSLIYKPTGMELLKPPGLMSYYRIFSSGIRYGKSIPSGAIRDWPVKARLVDGGALEIRFPPGPDHPMEITGIFRWRSTDTLDLETTVQTPIALPQMEVFLSGYFVDGFDALVYVKRNIYGTGPEAEMLRVDWSPLIDGNYVMFPRDRQALQMSVDGRWDFPPNPVLWAFVRYLAAPIGVRRHTGTGLTAVLMSPPVDCFTIATPYNKRPADGVAGHSSLYMSLFGCDAAAGQTTKARCRFVLGKNLSDEAVVQRYKQYLAEDHSGSPTAK
jgi:hypothetical protein